MYFVMFFGTQPPHAESNGATLGRSGYKFILSNFATARLKLDENTKFGSLFNVFRGMRM